LAGVERDEASGVEQSPNPKELAASSGDGFKEKVERSQMLYPV
jgi:hypothetical protein